jgi:lambda family phage portal protein
MSKLDKLIGYFSPQWQFKREFARNRNKLMANIAASSGILPAYDGASKSKRGLKSWMPNALSADRENSAELPTLNARSRDLFRNDTLARSAITTSVTNVIGSGLHLKCSIDAEFLGMDDDTADAWERITEREFRLWCKKENCDAEAKLTFYGLQELAFISVLQSGDVFATLPFIKRPQSPYNLKVQMIEADRVCNQGYAPDTDTLSGGVETDRNGTPVNYHILKTHPNGFNPLYEWEIVPARGRNTGRANVIHLFKVERVGQNRGVPFLAPVIEDLNLLKRYSQAELMAALVSGLFTVFIETESGQALETFVEDETQDEGELNLGAGAIVDLAAGEKVNPVNPMRPNPAFDAFVTAVCRRIGAALEVPYELLMKSFTASYSASRASLLEAWKFFKTRRIWVADNFCQPLFEEWITEAILNERISAPGFFDDPAIREAYLQCQWIGPAQGQIDPVKETQAAILKINNGLSSRSLEASAIGGDWEANHRQLVKEARMRREGQLDPGAVSTRPAPQTVEDEQEDEE